MFKLIILIVLVSLTGGIYGLENQTFEGFNFEVDDMIFFISETKETWFIANKKCTQMDLALIDINDPWEHRRIVKFIKSLGLFDWYHH